MEKNTDLTLILYCTKTAGIDALDTYRAIAGQLIIVSPRPADTFGLPEGSAFVYQKPETGKAHALNEAVRLADTSHIMWLEEGESIPAIPELGSQTFYAARIFNEQSPGSVGNWQVRLFPNPDSVSDMPCFSGFEIPDIQEHARRNNWQRSDDFLSIRRSAPLVWGDSIKKEAESEPGALMHPFWQGILAAEQQNFKKAISCFSEVLEKEDHLFFWNKLAALNSLANALMEVQRAEQAKAAAERSLNLSANQWAPYLTLHQYYHLKGDWNRAYAMLAEYRAASRSRSAANWDVYLPEEEAAFLMAEISFGRGRHQHAYRHYKEFYAYHEGNVSSGVLEKLFIYAIELEEQQKAIEYFQALFGPVDSGYESGAKAGPMLEALAMFTEKGWYDFPSSVYRQLVREHPQNEAIRHGCIRTLVKSNQIEKAQALL